MTEEEAFALSEKWTKITPKVGANGSGFLAKRKVAHMGCVDNKLSASSQTALGGKFTRIAFLFMFVLIINSCTPNFDYDNIEHINFTYGYIDGNTHHRYEFVIIWRDELWRDEPVSQYLFTGAYITTQLIPLSDEYEFDDRSDVFAGRWDWGSWDWENREVISGQVWDISPAYMEQLRQILMSYNISAWNGFRAPENRSLHDSFFWLRAISSSNRCISASGHDVGSSGVEAPEGFDEVFPILVAFFDDMFQRYIVKH